MPLFSRVCYFHHIKQSEKGIICFGKAISICVPVNEEQTAYIKYISERTKLIRGGRFVEGFLRAAMFLKRNSDGCFNRCRKLQIKDN